MSDATAMKSQLARLAAHITAMRLAIDTLQRHLHDSEAVMAALLEQQHGVAGRAEGLRAPEERGS
ncbi:MAG TPA: hypothetical protein VGW35_23965 [Methylomirabilota bacterium]|jgi:hypothetical protein|nr:hypothetical protein [Methylomirabilota bacterium]